MSFVSMLLLCFLLTANCFKIKVNNSLGKNVVATVICIDKDGNKPRLEGKMNNKDDRVFTVKPNCKTDIQCFVGTSNKKRTDWSAFKGCRGSDVAYYMRGDAVYQGDMFGNNLVKKSGWSTLKGK